MKITIKNISGIQSETVMLNKGLNVIRAPNATGKTSIVNSLKLTTLPEKELKNHPEFLNDFANEGSVAIEYENIKDDRKVRRYGNELAVVGDQLFNSNGKSVLLFADPDNEILEETTKGRSIESFIEKFSDVEVYQKLNSEVLVKVIEKLKAYYNEDSVFVGKLKTIEQELEEELKEREALSKERDKIKPQYDKAQKQNKKLGEITAIGKQKDGLIAEIENLKQGLKTKEKQVPLLQKELEDATKRKEDFQKNEPKIEKEKEDLHKELGKIEAIQEDKETELSKLDDNIDTLEQVGRNIDWSTTKDCPVCGRPITPSVKSKWQSHLESERKKVNAELLKITNQIKEIKNRIDDIEDEQNKANELNDIIKEITLKLSGRDGIETQIRADKKDIEAKEKIIEKLRNDISVLKKQVDPALADIVEKMEQVLEKIGLNDGTIKHLEIDRKEAIDKQKGLFIQKSKIEFVQQIVEKIKNIITEKKNGVKNIFNARIKEVYNVLGFKNFDEISINDSYKIEVVRKGKQQELNRLSTSERVTIGVIMMLAGKEEYLPDFPFFVMDEVVTAYDPTRFKKIIEYISNKTKTNYVIVTAFSPSGDKVKIERSI